MKNITTLCAAALLFTACSLLDENPLNGPSTGGFPSSAEEAQAGVLGVYKNLANSVTTYQSFPIRQVDQITDIGCMRRGLGSGGCWDQFKTSVQSPENTIVEHWYNRIYKTAGRLHLVLDNLDNLMKSGEVEEQTYNIYKAELLLLRSYVYDSGCQFYGDIPFIDHALNLSDYLYPRDKKEDVIARIFSEITDELIDNLPIQWPREVWGTCRLGRAAAYALKARIALNWGMFAEAARCSKIALELSEGVYELTPLDTTYYPTAADGEPDQTPLFGFVAETTSKEWMWAIQFNVLAASNTHGSIYGNAPRILNGSAGAGPTQSFIDSFQCLDGKSIAESPLYDWQNPWKNRDPRLDLYTIRPNSRVMGIECTTDVSKTTVMDYNTGNYIVNADVSGNKSEYGINGVKGCGGYLWRKFIDPYYYGKITGAKYEDDLDVPIIRLAELLLIDAEANIEMEGGDLERAASQINKVRARVNMPPVTARTRDELRSALRYERKVELCGEGFRWFDLRRWASADEKRLGESFILENALGGEQWAPPYGTTVHSLPLSNGIPTIDENWIVTYDGRTWDGQALNLRSFITLVFREKDKVWPIPYTEMTTNPMMTQNPGY